jgi:hypothetical protein
MRGVKSPGVGPGGFMAAPTLTGFAPSLAFDENTVNAAPQLLDFDVTFADAEGNFDGCILTLDSVARG